MRLCSAEAPPHRQEEDLVELVDSSLLFYTSFPSLLCNLAFSIAESLWLHSASPPLSLQRHCSVFKWWCASVRCIDLDSWRQYGLGLVQILFARMYMYGHATQFLLFLWDAAEEEKKRWKGKKEARVEAQQGVIQKNFMFKMLVSIVAMCSSYVCIRVYGVRHRSTIKHGWIIPLYSFIYYMTLLKQTQSCGVQVLIFICCIFDFSFIVCVFFWFF